MSELANRPVVPLQAALADINTLYADFELKCEDRSWKVHRLVLHCHSDFFQRAFKSQFKESKEREMKVDESDEALTPVSDVVQAMLDCFYKLDYTVPDNVNPFIFHMQVLRMADFYQSPLLHTTALRNFKSACSMDWITRDLVEAVRWLKIHPHESTVLQPYMLEYVHNKFSDLIKDEEFRELIHDLPQWNVSLLKHLKDKIDSLEGATSLLQLSRSAGR